MGESPGVRPLSFPILSTIAVIPITAKLIIYGVPFHYRAM